jgi:hypothetical protein
MSSSSTFRPRDSPQASEWKDVEIVGAREQQHVGSENRTSPCSASPDIRRKTPRVALHVLSGEARAEEDFLDLPVVVF